MRTGPGPSQVPGDDQAAPAASKAPGATKASRPHATPVVGRGGPTKTGHDGSGASSGSGGSADGDEDTTDAAHDGGGSDDSSHGEGSDEGGRDGTDDQILSDDSVLSFFWSPDSSKIAYIIRARGDQGALQLVANGAQQPCAIFEPEDFPCDGGRPGFTARRYTC